MVAVDYASISEEKVYVKTVEVVKSVNTREERANAKIVEVKRSVSTRKEDVNAKIAKRKLMPKKCNQVYENEKYLSVHCYCLISLDD